MRQTFRDALAYGLEYKRNPPDSFLDDVMDILNDVRL